MQLTIFKRIYSDRNETIAINRDSVLFVTPYFEWVNAAQKYFFVAGWTKISFNVGGSEDLYTELVEGTFEEVISKFSPVTDFLTALGL